MNSDQGEVGFTRRIAKLGSKEILLDTGLFGPKALRSVTIAIATEDGSLDGYHRTRRPEGVAMTLR